jgi:hypothetical protein
MSENQELINAIEKLFINACSNNYIFIYTPPKVGSTTLVTSLRISLGRSFNVIHIHDEIMLEVLTGISGVTINDILNYLSNENKNVFVIDVYRTPIERKMSAFFEKLSPYHFNNSENNIVNNYSIKRISDRFNKLFLHLENQEYYFDKYNIKDIVPFDFHNKYTIQEINNIKYIKLRLCDSDMWGNILSSIFKNDIVIINDYTTENKIIGDLYKKFKEEYQLPYNYFKQIENNKYLKYYYNEEEQENYLDFWKNKTYEYNFKPYNKNEFSFYMKLCLENQYINDIQLDHYIDSGCFCKLCTHKRRNIFIRAKGGETKFEKIIHENLINKEKQDRIHRFLSYKRALVRKKGTRYLRLQV